MAWKQQHKKRPAGQKRKTYAASLPESGGPLLAGQVSRWAGVMLEAGLAAIALLLLLVIWIAGGQLPIPVPALCGAVGVLWAAGAGYLPFFCHSCRFALGDGYIEFTSGIFFQIRRRMSIGAVTAVSELRAPLSNLTGTRSLYLSAMGGGLLLPFLKAGDAEAVEGYILLRMGKAAGNG